jgi:hypothetical protein
MGLISLHALFPSVLGGFQTRGESAEDPSRTWLFFEKEEQLVIKEIVDIIIPGTSTKSASETGVHIFLDEVFGKCLSPDQRKLMKTGIFRATADWNSQQDKVRYVKMLDNKAFMNDPAFQWFKIVKQYTMIGFFTSEEGTTRAGDYQKMPAAFVGEIPVSSGAPGHSKTFLKYYF